MTTATQCRMTGSIIGACSCDWGCPCNFDARPTQGYCDGGYTWHIDEGSFGDVTLDGLNLGLHAHAPGPVHEGHNILNGPPLTSNCHSPTFPHPNPKEIPATGPVPSLRSPF